VPVMQQFTVQLIGWNLCARYSIAYNAVERMEFM
jgi:hypothetical protein